MLAFLRTVEIFAFKIKIVLFLETIKTKKKKNSPTLTFKNSLLKPKRLLQPFSLGKEKRKKLFLGEGLFLSVLSSAHGYVLGILVPKRWTALRTSKSQAGSPLGCWCMTSGESMSLLANRAVEKGEVKVVVDVFLQSLLCLNRKMTEWSDCVQES